MTEIPAWITNRSGLRGHCAGATSWACKIQLLSSKLTEGKIMANGIIQVHPVISRDIYNQFIPYRHRLSAGNVRIFRLLRSI